MKKFLTKIETATLLIAATFIMSSCNSSSSESNKTAADSTATAQAQPAAKKDTAQPAKTDTAAKAKLTDPEIASIAVTANQYDVDIAKIAMANLTNPEAKEFAKTMMKDHQSIIDKAVALAKKLGVTPQDNPTSQSLLQDEQKTKDMLSKTKKGADYDKAYIDHEVAYHKAAIDIVTNTLIPNTTNQELKDFLTSAGPLFQNHLQMAEKAQADLAKK